MAGQDKATWVRRRSAWTRALIEIAGAQGVDSDLYAMLGTVAWGRFDGEACPDELKDNVVFGAGFLQGVQYAALQAGERFNVVGTYELRRIHEKIDPILHKRVD